MTAPTLFDAIKTWTRIGFLSFGGPTAQIALMHKIAVDEKRWLSEQQFLNALSFCMVLPGPEAMQLATYTGWRLHGIVGGLAAGLLFVVPGALVVLALAVIYAAFGKAPSIEALFLGIKAAVLVIVVEALIRVANRALARPTQWIIAALSFVAIFFFALPFPLIVVMAAGWGYLSHTATPALPTHEEVNFPAKHKKTAQTIIFWLVLWIAPLLGLYAALGPHHVLSQIGLFFSQLAVVTFGGAYAVLAYMAQDVVQHYQWLEAGQMMDGLGLAETTPGPLILVTEFVGFLAAYQSGEEPKWVMGFAGAIVALWATFAPCFLWIFAGAPYIEWITAQPKLKSALSAITAAVVGVILNLSFWFALHVFFRTVDKAVYGPLTLWYPSVTSLDWRVIALALVAGILLFRQNWPVFWVLAVTALLSLSLVLSERLMAL